MIRRISDELHISTDVLIKPTRTLGGPFAQLRAGAESRARQCMVQQPLELVWSKRHLCAKLHVTQME